MSLRPAVPITVGATVERHPLEQGQVSSIVVANCCHLESRAWSYVVNGPAPGRFREVGLRDLFWECDPKPGTSWGAANGNNEDPAIGSTSSVFYVTVDILVGALVTWNHYTLKKRLTLLRTRGEHWHIVLAFKTTMCSVSSAKCQLLSFHRNQTWIYFCGWRTSSFNGSSPTPTSGSTHCSRTCWCSTSTQSSFVPNVSTYKAVKSKTCLDLHVVNSMTFSWGKISLRGTKHKPM